jgi:hypothetical protein
VEAVAALVADDEPAQDVLALGGPGAMRAAAMSFADGSSAQPKLVADNRLELALYAVLDLRPLRREVAGIRGVDDQFTDGVSGPGLVGAPIGLVVKVIAGAR